MHPRLIGKVRWTKARKQRKTNSHLLETTSSEKTSTDSDPSNSTSKRSSDSGPAKAKSLASIGSRRKIIRANQWHKVSSRTTEPRWWSEVTNSRRLLSIKSRMGARVLSHVALIAISKVTSKRQFTWHSISALKTRLKVMIG